MEINDIKSALDAQATAWEAFKASNDERIKAESKGVADVLFEEKAKKLNETLDAIAAQIKAIEVKAARPAVGADAEELDGFKSNVGGWLRTGRTEGATAEIKSLSIGVNADGGFAVPKVIDTMIEKLSRDISPIRSIANVVQITTNDYNKLVNINGTTSGWVAETAARTATNTPQFASIQISPSELYVNAQATQPALDDPQFDMEAWLMENIYEEFFRAEGAAFCVGTGANQPTGFTAGTPVSTADSGRAFGVLQYTPSGGAGAMPTSIDTYITLVHALKREYRSGAQWVTNKAALATMRTYKDTTNQYLWQPTTAAGTPSQFLGYDLIEAEDMPALAANAFPVAFGNFKRGYQIVDRKDVGMIRDPYSNKPYVGFYAVKRVGGKVVNSEAIKLLKASIS